MHLKQSALLKEDVPEVIMNTNFKVELYYKECDHILVG